MIRIPLGDGGEELASSADGVGEVRDGCLCVVIEPWLAQNLRVRAGSLVVVDNRGGRFTITRSEKNDRFVH